MEFSYELDQKDDLNVISVSGNLIEKNQAIEMLDEIEDLILKESNRFIINMTSFKYLNSTGLNVLINILTKERKTDGEVIICCVHPKINEMLIITNLYTILTVDEDL